MEIISKEVLTRKIDELNSLYEEVSTLRINGAPLDDIKVISKMHKYNNLINSLPHLYDIEDLMNARTCASRNQEFHLKDRILERLKPICTREAYSKIEEQINKL